MCKSCDYAFIKKENLTIHLRTHNEEKPHGCLWCEKKYWHESDVKRHMNIKHYKLKIYSCSECNRTFHEKDKLDRHMAHHTKVKAFSCPTCGELFSQKGHIGRHVDSVHKGLKPFTCHICDKPFATTTSGVLAGM